MTYRPDFSSVVAAFEGNDRFLLACHERADGDALGSLIALGLYLRSIGKSAVMYSPGGVPELYRFLPYQEEIIGSLQDCKPEEVEVVVCLDCDGLARAGELSQWLEAPPPGTHSSKARGSSQEIRRPLVIDVDHHEPEKAFGDIRLVFPQAAATAVLVYGILTEMKASISQEVATCLLTGVYLDTGSLRYDNTTEEVFRIGAKLTSLGARPAFVARGLYETKSLPALRLLGRALCNASLVADGKVVFALLTEQDFQETGAQREDTEGIIDLLRAERDTLVAALFIQQNGAQVKVSLRSKGNLDVSAIASRYGGGGHARAAGFTMQGPLEKAAPAVINEVAKLLR
jgi:phosphoesterase RecJ-like protein